MRAEGLAAVAFFGHGLLLRIDPFAVLVLRAHQHCARRSHGSKTSARHGSITAKQKDIVAQSLKIVGSPVPQLLLAFTVKHRALLVGFHLQMAAVATGRPWSVTRVASHAAVGMRVFHLVLRHASPGAID